MFHMNVTRVFSTFVLASAAIIITHNAADARNNKEVIAHKIQTNFETFESMLNEKSEPEALMAFLHETISNEANIKLTVRNNDDQAVKPTTVNLNKADYINSYIYGPRQVANYRASIKTLEIQIDEANQAVHSTEILMESGTMKNPHDFRDQGKDFSSRTMCKSEHSIDNNNNVVLKSSTCETNIFYEQEA